MKLRSLPAMVAILVATFCGSTSGAERVLLDKFGYVEPAKEAAVLDWRALETLKVRRTVYKRVYVVSLNLSALAPGVMSMTLPDGSQHHFNLKQTDMQAQGLSGVGYYGERMERRGGYGNIIVQINMRQISGQLQFGNVLYALLGSTSDKYQLLAEHLPRRPMWEPPSMSGRDDTEVTPAPQRP
jgi:hypothetical protein